jgi:hypothetical protein
MDKPGTQLVTVPHEESKSKGQASSLSLSALAAPIVKGTQLGNKVSGDQALGNIDKSTNYYGLRQLTAMTRVIQEYAQEEKNNPDVRSIVDALEHYMTVTAEGDIRSLEEKLTSAGRDDQVAAARLRKHEATKFVMRHGSSPSAQRIIAFLLAKLQHSYEHHVLPLINSGGTRAQVDAAIEQHVVEPAWSFLETNPLDIDHRMLDALLYFLGGNCHIRWDPC